VTLNDAHERYESIYDQNGEFWRKLKLKDARERYESIYDQNLFSHVLAPKRPKNFWAKSQPKWRMKKHQVISPNICSASTAMGPEWRAWREVSDEDAEGTSWRLGFGGAVRHDEEVVTLGLQQFSTVRCGGAQRNVVEKTVAKMP
jgi:hypothetical protein